MMLLFCPETTYRRDHAFDIDQLQNQSLEKLAAREQLDSKNPTTQDLEKSTAIIPQVDIRCSTSRQTYLQSLAIFTGIYSHDNFFKLLIAPFITLLNAAALYTCISSGLLAAWYVGGAITMAGIFSRPPWLLNPAGIGYFAAGPFIGATVGSIIIALVSDPLAKWATKKNKGI